MTSAKLPFTIALALTLGACSSHVVRDPVPAGGGRVIGYYFGPTTSRGFTVSKIDGELVTHVNYAFANILPDGSAALGNARVDTVNFPALRELRQRYPKLHVLISFGGWGGSKYFSEAAATKQSRRRFVESTLDIFFRTYPGVFDGVDLDWEYPVRGGLATNVYRSQDRQNLTALVRELRKALDREAGKDKHYLITIAVPAGATHIEKYEMKKLGKLLDYVSLMTYDFHGTWGGIAHFNSPLGSAADDPTPEWNVKKSVEAYLAAGVPRDRIVVGVPFYGYGFAPVAESGNGRFQAIGAADSTRPRPRWSGAVRFYDIKNVLADGFQRFWDADASVPWLYNAATHTFVTYDDAESIGAKARYARDQKLGGVMIWELSGDDGSLLPAIRDALKH